jgi:hypothetical protein
LVTSDYLSLSLRPREGGCFSVNRAMVPPPPGVAPVLQMALYPQPPSNRWPGVLIAVTGSGGTGVSTAARAIADRLGNERRVVLADLRLDAELAPLLGVPAAAPGMEELVDACRRGPPVDPLGYTTAVRGSAYLLLPGVHARRAWTALRPPAVAAALEAVLAASDLVVADVDPDVEGEDEGGSIDVEERNVMARTATQAAALVVVVAAPGAKGALSAGRVAADLLAFGVEARRLVTITGPDAAIGAVVVADLDPPRRRVPRPVTPGTLGVR